MDFLGEWVVLVLKILFFSAVGLFLLYLLFSLFILIFKACRLPKAVRGTVRAVKYNNSVRDNIPFIQKKPIDFDRSFKYKCQYCDFMISAQNGICPHCTGTNGTNPEYLRKRREIGEKYISILKKKQLAVETAEQNIIKSQTYSGSETFFPGLNSAFNVVLRDMPSYTSPEAFSFTCLYCGRSLLGKSNDGKICPSCSSSYADNIELLEKEQEDALERKYYSEYKALQRYAERVNRQNEYKDFSASAKRDRENYVLGRIAKIIIKSAFGCGIAAAALFITVMILYFFSNFF